MWMTGDLVLLIVAQVAAGGIVAGVVSCSILRLTAQPRRRRVRLAETAQGSLYAAAFALAATALVGALVWTAAPEPAAARQGVLRVPLVVCGLCGAPGALAALAILAAGRAEARGRRRRAARRVDTAGRSMFLSCAGYATALVGTMVLSSASTRALWLPDPWSPGLLALSAIAIGLAGFVGLLAGLSRKPRPSGTFAALLYVAGHWALLSALGL